MGYFPIERGKPSPGRDRTAKYRDHLPLYRQSEVHARKGIDLARSTMADWAGKQCHTIETTPRRGNEDRALRTYVGNGRPHGDETPPAV